MGVNKMILRTGNMIFWRFKCENAYRQAWPFPVERGMWKMVPYNDPNGSGQIVDSNDIETK